MPPIFWPLFGAAIFLWAMSAPFAPAVSHGWYDAECCSDKDCERYLNR